MGVSMDIIGSFADDQLCAKGIADLRHAAVEDFHVFSPIPSHHIEHAMGKPKSRVRLFVLLGGITGILTALALTIGTTWEWNLGSGGKPMISWPPFIIICFELMILFGGLSAVTSFIVNAGLPAFNSASGYNSRFGEDRFGVVVRCDAADGDRLEKIESILRNAGAEEVLRDAA
ncbi:MAG TPA: DUF3341 domain-containing protein [Candidatus Binataceae bacterium]|nr:DUF3341 domain-containing protein [Candidatus Binataceae bacterium]